MNKPIAAALPILLAAFMLALAGCVDNTTATQTSRPRATGPRNQATIEFTQEGEQALGAGNLQQALRLFNEALEADPANVEAHVGVGDIYQQAGNIEKAAQKYAEARRIQPDHFESNYKLGLMYHLMNRIRDAIQTYLAALTINPESFDANLNLATAYLQINKPALALPYAERAVRINPGSQAAQVNLGSIYSALGRHDEAVLAYRNAADLGELDGPVAINLANALIKSGKYQRAVNTLQTLLRSEPNANYYERLGYALFKLRRYDQSMEAYQEALALKPDDASALNGLGVNLMTRYIQGDRQQRNLRDRALKAWRNSVQLHPDQPHIIELISRYGTL